MVIYIFPGWCTTRQAGVNENVRPTPTKGWGFCATDPSQENCNGYITPKVSISCQKCSNSHISFLI